LTLVESTPVRLGVTGLTLFSPGFDCAEIPPPDWAVFGSMVAVSTAADCCTLGPPTVIVANDVPLSAELPNCIEVALIESSCVETTGNS
jgi:hypothetical protein